MTPRCFVTTLVLAILPFAVSTAQQNTVDWHTSLAQAQQEAAAQNKLVLVHFWGSYCRPCLNLEHFVFTNPTVASAIDAQFVPVKINVEVEPGIAKQFGIRTIPHDVVLTPEGQMFSQRASPNNTDGYLQMIDTVASRYGRTDTTTIDAAHQIAEMLPGTDSTPPFIPAGQQSIESEPLAMINATGSGPVRPIASQPMDGYGESMASAVVTSEETRSTERIPASPREPSPLAGVVRTNPYATSAPLTRPASGGAGMSLTPLVESAASPLTNQPRPTTATTSPLALPAPIGIDGHCPVTLSESGNLVAGDRRWGCVHRGRLYFFGSQDAFERFQQNPDRFSPMLAGFDPVEYANVGKLVPGRLDTHHIQASGDQQHVFLFASEKNREVFRADPSRYVQEVQTAMRYADSPVILR